MKLVTMRDLKSLGFGLAGSSPATRTKQTARSSTGLDSGVR